MVIVKKRSKSETGHFKNLMNFEDLLARFNALMGRYNPARPELQLGSLQQLFQEAQMVMERLTTASTMNDTATNTRADLFDKLGPTTTSVVNYLIAGGASAKTIEDAKGFQRKMQGVRAGKKGTEPDAPTEETDAAAMANDGTEKDITEEDKTRSAAQLSYDLKIEHFSKLLSLAQNEPTFQPREEELQIGALQNFLQQLRMANTAKAYADAELEAARRERTRVFYHPETGLVARALQAKAYAKAVLGASSEDYKHIHRINFRMIG